MDFLSPWMLIGGGALAIPIIVHLIGRRQARRIPFAALSFLLGQDKRTARHLALRRWWLLLARALLLLLLVLTLAKPVWRQKQAQTGALRADAEAVVILLDDTLSMRREFDGLSLFELARRRARSMVRRFSGRTRIGLLRVSEVSGPIATPTLDRARVLAALGKLRCSYRHASLGPAVARAQAALRALLQRPVKTAALGASAAAALPATTAKHGQIVLLSDFARHGLGSLQALGDLGPQIDLVPIDLAQSSPLDNVAVVELKKQASQVTERRSARIAAKVCNHGRQPKRVPVRLSIDQSPVAQGWLALGPQACAVKRFDHSFARRGAYQVRVSAEVDEALRDDNQAQLLVQLHSGLRVLLVNGAPSSARQQDELFYVRSALRSAPAESRQIAVSEWGEERLTADAALDPFDVVVLANVGQIQSGTGQRLKRFVERGGGLLLSLGDAVIPDTYNANLAPLLPRRLRGVARYGVASMAGATAILRFGKVDRFHPLLTRLREAWTATPAAAELGLAQARFSGAFRLHPAPQKVARVLIRFDSGAPALLERRVGRGRVLLFVSTIDRDWSDLPIRPGFVPLLQQMVRYLAAALGDERQVASLVGQSRRLTSDAAIQRLRITDPDGAQRSWDLATTQSKGAVEIAIDRPGFYQVEGWAERGWRPLPALSFAANLDSSESRLAKAELRDRDTAAAHAGRGNSQPGDKRPSGPIAPLWPALALGLVLLLLVESWLGSPRARSGA